MGLFSLTESEIRLRARTASLRWFGRDDASARRGQWFAPLFEQEQPLIDDVPKLCVHLSLIITIATWPDDSQALADKTLVFV